MTPADSVAAIQLAARKLDVIDSAVKIGLGGIFGVVGGWGGAFIAGRMGLRLERIRQREERRKDAFKSWKVRIVDPIIGFTDDLLACVSELKSTITERAVAAADRATKARQRGEKAPPDQEDEPLPASFNERLVNLRNREALIDARIYTLKDPALTEAFRQLSLQIRNVGAAKGFGAAHDEAKKAAELGAKVLDRLGEIERQTEASAEVKE
jgi:hypothetical protein